MATNIADKKNNNLPLWGNEKTMNLNNMILTNILSSHYFKVNLYELKTYHEVIDEIYYKVAHLEPWEKGSRVTSGQTGMCGGVRGVGAGGIVSTSFCILYKLFTLKLTRKQVVGLINHTDSPYIRALGFMYIRYTQPPADLWEWYKLYLDDDEKIDVKAGGGKEMTIGDMLQHFLSKLEWFSTLFPRIPVPIQKQIEKNLSEWRLENQVKKHTEAEELSPKRNHVEDETVRNSYHKNGDFNDRADLEDERYREKRQKYDRERYEQSKHYPAHSSRGRSRSPHGSRSSRDDKKIHSRHRDSSDHHRDRDRSREERHKGPGREDRREDRSRENRHRTREDRHSDRSREDWHRDRSKEDRASKSQKPSSNHHSRSCSHDRHSDSFSHKKHR